MCVLAKAYNILEENAHRSSISASWLTPSRGWFELPKEHPEKKTSEENYKTINYIKDSLHPWLSVSSASQTELNGEQRVACTRRWVYPYTLNRKRVLTTMQLPSELQEATLSLLKIPGITLFLGFFFNLRAKGYLPSWFPVQNKTPPLPLSPSFSSFYPFFQWPTTHYPWVMFLHHPWLLQSYITYRIWTSWLLTMATQSISLGKKLVKTWLFKKTWKIVDWLSMPHLLLPLLLLHYPRTKISNTSALSLFCN